MGNNSQNGSDLNGDKAAKWSAVIDGELKGDKSDTNALANVEILSQEGIDILLGYKFHPRALSDAKGMQLLTNSNMIMHHRLPVLEVIFDRFVRLATTSLRNFTSDSVEVSLESLEQVRLGDYSADICLPAVLSIFKAEEWDYHGLVSFDHDLMYSMVDILLGGRRSKIPSTRDLRPYTSIELALAEQITQLVLKDVEHSFEPVETVHMNFVRMENDPRFAAIGRPTDSGFLAVLRLDMEGRGGYMEILLPFAMLEPIRTKLSQSFVGEGGNTDNIWENHLSEEINEATVEVKAVLSEQWLTLQDMLSLNVGDVIDLAITPQNPVEIRCGNAILGQGDVGQKGKNVAVSMREENSFSAQEILTAQTQKM